MSANTNAWEPHLSRLNRFTIIALILAAFPLPYGYYIFLRWLVLASATLHIIMGVSRHRIAVVIIFIPIAILFNPIAPIHLPKGLWFFIDLLSAMLVAVGYDELEKKK